MIVYGLYHCFRHEGSRLLGLFQTEASAKEDAAAYANRWTDHIRWGRVTNQSHDLGKCLRGVLIRETPWVPTMYDNGEWVPGPFISRVFSWMMIIVPIEVNP